MPGRTFNFVLFVFGRIRLRRRRRLSNEIADVSVSVFASDLNIHHLSEYFEHFIKSCFFPFDRLLPLPQFTSCFIAVRESL